LRRVELAYEVGGFVVLGVVYAATRSSELQTVVLVAYSLCVGAHVLWWFRTRASLTDSSTATSRQGKLESLGFLVVWGAIVILAVEPASREAVGPWFSWWLVIVPSIEFDRQLKRRAARRQANRRGLAS
jgi:hypothetical protein